MASKALVLFLAVNLVLLGVATPGAFGTTCPIDTLKLGVCVDLLTLLKANLGVPPTQQCCPLISGLADLEAAVCLCTTLKASVLGINLILPADISLILNYCGKGLPSGFVC